MWQFPSQTWSNGTGGISLVCTIHAGSWDAVLIKLRGRIFAIVARSPAGDKDDCELPFCGSRLLLLLPPLLYGGSCALSFWRAKNERHSVGLKRLPERVYFGQEKWADNINCLWAWWRAFVIAGPWHARFIRVHAWQLFICPVCTEENVVYSIVAVSFRRWNRIKSAILFFN